MHCLKYSLMAVAVIAMVSGSTNFASVIPPNPMMTGGGMGQMGMYHGMISINAQNEVVVHLGPGMTPPGNTPVLPLVFTPDTHGNFTDESVTGGPDWTVLNGRNFNSQFGWMAGNAGAWTVPTGDAIWIEPIGITGPGTLDVFEGGQGSTSPLLPMNMHTLNPIFVGGQAWKWFDRDYADANNPPFIASGSGIMTHNWYVTDTPGHYQIDYRVYVGNAITGAANTTFTPAQVAVSWVPEPSSCAIFSFGALMLTRRKRRKR